MARTNVAQKKEVVRTHEGGIAKRINAEEQLRRSVMCCMLWENEFYEDGESIADRIAKLIPKVPASIVAGIAIDARLNMKLRHVPLHMAVEMLKHDTHRKHVRKVLATVIERADELAEVFAIYWKNGRIPIRKQLRRGVADAFKKFNSFQLSRYANREGAVSLRDVMFLTHPNPNKTTPDLSQADKAIGKEMKKFYKALASRETQAPDTWEVQLSAGKDKKNTFTRLIKEGKIGGLAMLRNLRNMRESGVAADTIRLGLKNLKAERVLPFRFIAAANYAPGYEPELEEAMFKSLKELDKLPGRTILLIDVSGSMQAQVSSKSDITRLDAACGVAMLVRELTSSAVFTFSTTLKEIPARRGFALRDAVKNSQPHGGTDLGGALARINKVKCDRLIVITDEQSSTEVPNPHAKYSYLINVASAQNGVGYGKWTHIDGWSEAVISFITEWERANGE